MKIENVEKPVGNLYYKTENVIHIRNLKQALNHGLVLKKLHRIVKFKQKALLKCYIDMKTDLRKKEKHDVENFFFQLMNNAVFGKTMENMKKHRAIKLVATEWQINHLMSEPNYNSTKVFT